MWFPYKKQRQHGGAYTRLRYVENTAREMIRNTRSNIKDHTNVYRVSDNIH